MSAVKDRLVNVPVSSSDIINTVKNIPRTPKEAGLIQVKLKRKLKYKNYHKHEFIDTGKIFKMLEYLKKSGHPHYQFYDEFDVYRKRCSMSQTRVEEKRKKVQVKFVSDTQSQQIANLEKNT